MVLPLPAHERPAVIFDREPQAGHRRIVPAGIAKPRSNSSGAHRRPAGALDQSGRIAAVAAGDRQAIVEHLARLARCIARSRPRAA